jgi:PilZ domain
MHKGQLATLPAAEGRRAERRVVNLAASLREPGANVVDAEVLNLSLDGFMAVTEMALETGQVAFLKLPGLAPCKAEVVWIDGGKAGFKFSSPLHPGELDQLVGAARRTPPRNHFGPRRG